MELNDIRVKLETLPEDIESAEIAYVSKKAELTHMQDMTKHLLNNLKSEYDGSNVERERLAYSSEEFKKHIDGLNTLNSDVGKLGAVLHRLQNEFEAMRSLNKNIV